jgi:DNA helicase II / ATP-dependent DNA helicase PcrA
MTQTSAALEAVAQQHTCHVCAQAGLTTDQRTAVEHGYGPLMVFAGPGAGKTRTITQRIAHLLHAGWGTSSQILAVTFTVAAAGEMRERLATMLGVDAIRGLTVATFHSVCARMLRVHAGCFGRTDQFTIYDQSELKKIIGDLLSNKDKAQIQYQLDQCGARGPDGRGAAAQIAAEISMAKNKLWHPAHYAQHSRHPLAPLIAAVWAEAEAELQAANAFDFDDLLVYGVRLLAEYPQLLAHYRTRWPWMLVDEFQDTNFAQMCLVSLLAGAEGNLTVVADDDQLLYTFRGAEPANVLKFGDWFPNFRSVTLGRNYRCRAEILTAAVNCVQHNTERVPKALIANKGPGGRIDLPVFGNDRAEAEWIVGLVADALRSGVPSKEILLVSRNAYLTLPVQQALAANGIPYRVLGSLGLFERAEVRDAIAYLSVLANPVDAQAFRRAVNTPKRGVGPATQAAVIEYARDHHNGDLITACQYAEQIPGIKGRAAKAALVDFGTHMDAVRRDLLAGRSIGHAVVGAAMIPGGLVRYWQDIRDNDDDGEKRRDAERVLEDLRSLCSAANTYEQNYPGDASISGFLEQACGVDRIEIEGPDERITISTIHRSKGMEAHLVVVIACEERVIPSWRALEEAENDESAGGVEEERRMFYVALTRAKEHLVITQSRERGDGERRKPTDGPSRFLAESGLA